MDIYSTIGLLLAKIVSVLLPVLLTLFPNYGPFISMDQQIHNNTNVVAPIIAQAFVDRDVEALEEYMCLNIKETTEDLPGEIQKMFDLIDGEITETSIETLNAGGSWSSERAEGTILQSGIDIFLTTPDEVYRLAVIYEVINTMNPQEAKIRQISLFSKTNDNSHSIAKIKASEGIKCWHD